MTQRPAQLKVSCIYRAPFSPPFHCPCDPSLSCQPKSFFGFSFAKVFSACLFSITKHPNRPSHFWEWMKGAKWCTNSWSANGYALLLFYSPWFEYALSFLPLLLPFPTRCRCGFCNVMGFLSSLLCWAVAATFSIVLSFRTSSFNS